jgi:hypothetical protein
VALIAGGLGGPLAYRAGVPFGALELGANAWASLAVIGLVWAIAFPLLITLAGRLANGGRTGGEPRAQSGAAGKQRPAKPNLPNTRILAVFLLASTLGASSAALALDGDASLFVPVRTLHDVKLARRGVGRLRRWMIKGCDIALYTPPATPRNELLTGGPKALEFYYYVGIKGEQFARASEETLKGELSGETYARFKAQIDEMGSYFTAVEPGDRYLLYFVPGHGTALDLNGKRRGVIPGDAFADIYFRIWLGEKPLDKALYKGMTRGMK